MLTNIVFFVMWSGAEGSGDAVWRERGQVFSVLTKLGSSCQLVRPPDDIKRRSERPPGGPRPAVCGKVTF